MRTGTTQTTLDHPLARALNADNIHFLSCRGKRDALLMLIDALSESPLIGDKRELTERIFHREKMMSTGIGIGIGVPHVRLASISDLVMAVGVCHLPLTDYESLDGLPVHFVFMIAAGADQHDQHLKLLSAISAKMKNDEFRSTLLTAANPVEFHELLTM